MFFFAFLHFSKIYRFRVNIFFQKKSFDTGWYLKNRFFVKNSDVTNAHNGESNYLTSRRDKRKVMKMEGFCARDTYRLTFYLARTLVLISLILCV